MKSEKTRNTPFFHRYFCRITFPTRLQVIFSLSLKTVNKRTTFRNIRIASFIILLVQNEIIMEKCFFISLSKKNAEQTIFSIQISSLFISTLIYSKLFDNESYFIITHSSKWQNKTDPHTNYENGVDIVITISSDNNVITWKHNRTLTHMYDWVYNWNYNTNWYVEHVCVRFIVWTIPGKQYAFDA